MVFVSVFFLRIVVVSVGIVIMSVGHAPGIKLCILGIE